ncbi:MAG: UbiA family prenyltransferase [Gemmataceae bacterium]|nr:UbiA family prenyltransferase [Gemmataceae bacterium]MCI0737722.1 UbiA family prenyltransferase [Gemmataceae bacterium]
MMSFLNFARLVRLPNVFTVWADIGLAALVTAALPERVLPFLFLALASTCLYWSGMVWNDYFDIEQDKRERPFRPLASGKVSLPTGMGLGVGFMTAGVLCAAIADGIGGGHWQALWIALALAATILSYDGYFKRTLAGPFAMGACRFLNVLLGLSVAAQPIGAWGFFLALVVGVYIVGVTWFARTEAATSSQGQLLVGAGVMGGALLLALTVPPLAQHAGRDLHTSVFFPYLLAAFGFYVGHTVFRAIQQSSPERVQAAVKRAVLGLVLLDAVLATALVGIAGLGLALLIVPAQILGKWVYST